MNILKLTLSALLLGTIIACGGNNSKEEVKEEKQLTSKEIMQQEQNEQSATGNESQTVVADAQEVKEITIEGNDQMQFNLDEMKVKAGQTIRLTLKHVGKLSVEQMGHNWVLLEKGTDMMDFGSQSASAKDNGYIATSLESKVIAKTKLLGGGEEDTIEFEAPAKGTYDFICSFPGHVMIMQGKFIVE
jgi:azurin